MNESEKTEWDLVKTAMREILATVKKGQAEIDQTTTQWYAEYAQLEPHIGNVCTSFSSLDDLLKDAIRKIHELKAKTPKYNIDRMGFDNAVDYFKDVATDSLDTKCTADLANLIISLRAANDNRKAVVHSTWSYNMGTKEFVQDRCGGKTTRLSAAKLDEYFKEITIKSSNVYSKLDLFIKHIP